MGFKASKHPKLVDFINKHILKADKSRYITIVDAETNRHYKAEVQHGRFYYDSKNVCLKEIFKCFKEWYAIYWDCYDGKGGRVMIWARRSTQHFFYGSWKKVLPEITEELKKEIADWERIGADIKEEEKNKERKNCECHL